MVARLVRHHLLLADTAMRRDLGDPSTVEMVAERVGSGEMLELLAALTQADGIATGPAAWSAWKATLVDELVVRTRGFLAGERPDPVVPTGTADQRVLMAAAELRIKVDGSRLTVAAPDRPGLLALVAGALAGRNLSVLAASGLSEGGMAVQEFDLDLVGRDPPDWLQLEADLSSALDDPRALEVRLTGRARSTRLPPRPGAARIAPPRVLIDNQATPRATIVEVRAPDAVGLLARVAGALAESRCDISVVRALTLGHEVVDTFYVTDGSSGEKVTDPKRLGAVEEAILEAIARTLA
jgi:[protein-PII] uridylyltransferase